MTFEDAVKAIEDINIWQYGKFDLVGRIQVVFIVPEPEEEPENKAYYWEYIDNTLRQIAQLAQDHKLSNYDLRLAAKLKTNVTVCTLILNNEVIHTQNWQEPQMNWQNIAYDFNVASQLIGVS